VQQRPPKSTHEYTAEPSVTPSTTKLKLENTYSGDIYGVSVFNNSACSLPNVFVGFIQLSKREEMMERRFDLRTELYLLIITLWYTRIWPGHKG
jgi:hypothetical protein